MEFEGKYVSWGNRAVVFKLPKGDCLKVYRTLTGKEIPEKEFSLFEIFYGKGISVPKPREIVKVDLSPENLNQISHELLREEFSNSKEPFFALKREFIEGRHMGKSWFPPRAVWQNYVRLNEEIFALGYTPSDFIPQNYVVTPTDKVFFIDADEVREGAPEFMANERRYMRKVPNTPLGRAIFDAKGFCLESVANLFVRGH